MAVYRFSALASGQAISFNPGADVLQFDVSDITASDIQLVSEGSNLRIRVIDGVYDGKEFVLLSTLATQVTTSNVQFANGSVLIVGDNSTAGNDSMPGWLIGSSAGDLLHGLGGNDTLNGNSGDDRLFGGDGDDQLWGDQGNDTLNGGAGVDTLRGSEGDTTYVVTAGDKIIDQGGDDTVVAEVSWGLADGLENLILMTGTASLSATGNAGDNNIAGNDGDNAITGRAGNDFMLGLGGNDTFNMTSGGTASYGNDTIDGGAGFDQLNFASALSAVTADLAAGNASGGGQAGAGTVAFVNIERLVGGSFNDRLSGSTANDRLDGGAGNDTLAGGAGVDTLWGGSGADTFVFRETGTANADRINDFASGSDRIVLDASAMTVLGASGNFAADDARFVANSTGTAQDANDRVIFNTTTKQLFYDADGSDAGAAQLIATFQQSTATVIATDITVEAPSAPPPPSAINGTPGDDSIVGTSGSDTINGLGGNDILDGGGAADSLFGDEGNDSIAGGDDADYLLGGAGNDTLYGSDVFAANDNGWADTMDGGPGDDTYYVEPHDSISGDAGGIDTVVARATNWILGDNFENLTLRGQDLQGSGNALDNVIDASGVRNASLGGFAGNDLLITGSGANTASGSDGDDTVLGGDGQNVLYGGQGDDRLSTVGQGGLYGDEGNDTLVGGAASDTLDGGTGNDTLTGGAGADVFAYFRDPGAANADVITDFDSDTIQLDGSGFGNAGVSGRFVDEDGRFYAAPGATESHDADDRVIYDISTGRLYYDSDGNGSGAAQLFATLQGAPALKAADILVINGSSRIDGTSGDDSLVGTPASDTIFGYAGNDTIDGGAGDDFLSGNEGNDSVSGGAGNDVVSGREGNDTVLGGVGDDVVSGMNGMNTLDGGAGRDTLTGGALDATDAFLFTVAPGLANADLVSNFNSGQDKIRLDGSVMTALGASGDFTSSDARFTAGPGFSSGQDADDRVIFDTSSGNLWYDADGSGGGAALLIATVSGSAVIATDIAVDNGTAPPPPPPPGGGQMINGTSGNDTLSGTAGDDTIMGLEGNDLFLAGSTGGNDVINGGAGRDSIEFKERATSAITVDFVSGTITGGAPGTISFTSIERVLTGSFNDTLTGDAAAQTLTGLSGSDTIVGAGGVDTLWGGGGADVFIFREMGTANADSLSDFASGSDKLHLDDAAFTAIGAMGNFAAGDARFKANSSGTATDTNDRVVFNTSTGQLYYDADGSAGGAAQLIATVQSGATVAATDITVI